MCAEFNSYVLRDAREYRNADGKRYPVVPDIRDPLLSVAYFLEAWCGVIGRPARSDAAKRAESLGIVECEIRRHRMVRLSNVAQLVSSE